MTYQIRRLLAVAAAAARARTTGTLIKEGTKGPPPLPSSPGSQLFVVGGGASELVVLVVVSGEHGGNSGQGRGGSPTQIWVHEKHCSCFLYQTSDPSLIRQPLPPPSGRSCFPKAPRRPHPPNGLYQECPDSKDRGQQGLDRHKGVDSHRVWRPLDRGSKSCKESEGAG